MVCKRVKGLDAYLKKETGYCEVYGAREKAKLRKLVDSRQALLRNEGESPYRKRQRLNGKKVAYKQNRDDANIVYSYATYGATLDDIACVMGISKDRIQKYYSKDLMAGRSTANTKIAQSIYTIGIGREAVFDEQGNEIKKELKPNLTALIFLAKIRLGWHEVSIVEQTVGVKPAGVQIYLPDNGMKCGDSGDVGSGSVIEEGAYIEEGALQSIEYQEVKRGLGNET
jgi:hypothetical protein